MVNNIKESLTGDSIKVLFHQKVCTQGPTFLGLGADDCSQGNPHNKWSSLTPDQVTSHSTQNSVRVLQYRLKWYREHITLKISNQSFNGRAYRWGFHPCRV